MLFQVLFVSSYHGLAYVTFKEIPMLVTQAYPVFVIGIGALATNGTHFVMKLPFEIAYAGLAPEQFVATLAYAIIGA